MTLFRHSKEKDPSPPPAIPLLVREGCTGDRPAQAALIRHYQDRIAKFVVMQTGRDEPYEDLCQTIFVKMVMGLPRLRSVDHFEPWLFRIARNVCRDHLRRQRGWWRIFVPTQPEHDAIAAELPSSNDEMDRLEHAMERLPVAQRDLLRLSLEQHRSYDELARLSSDSVASVKSRLHRARRNLREILLVEAPNEHD